MSMFLLQLFLTFLNWLTRIIHYGLRDTFISKLILKTQINLRSTDTFNCQNVIICCATLMCNSCSTCWLGLTGMMKRGNSTTNDKFKCKCVAHWAMISLTYLQEQIIKIPVYIWTLLENKIVMVIPIWQN